MFHCKIDGDYIVLHDFEARSLFSEATGDPAEAMIYNMRMVGPGAKKRVQRNYRVIIEHLRHRKREDPDLFHRSYVFRSNWGPESLISLFALMDGHRRLAPYADCAELEEFDAMAADPTTLPDYSLPKSVRILLHSVCGLRRKRRTVIAEYQLLVRDLDHVFGTTKEFVVMMRHQKLKFTPDGLIVEARIRSKEGKTRRA